MNQKEIFFAGGCFWGIEESFSKLPGVISTEVGYMGGEKNNPSYKEVCTGTTGHAETVRVKYNPEKVSLEQLFDHFFSIHNPTTKDRQGLDVGTQYRSAIFLDNEEGGDVAKKYIKFLNSSSGFNNPVLTEVVFPAPPFYKAEEYHQKYFKKNNGGVCHT
jgi:methionine-S-sulfoxide reductase